ncbi:MAG: PQQ-like beta-propeller repeat protein [Acetobacteraceae bacterium]|nr:PQQ-like beta-propeller repeat protein [Acetobacteraceae bacterium]
MTRRGALLAGAGLLAGCETAQDLVDRVIGTPKVPLPGQRIAILQAEQRVEVDPAAAARPLTLPAPSLNTGWTVAGGNAGHAPGHLSLPRPIGEVWRTSIGSGTSYRRRMTAPPLVVENTVFAADSFGWVSALDAARGGRRWQTDTRPRQERDGALGAALAFADDTLYVATGLAEVMALDPANGTIKWRAPLPAPARGGLAVAGNRLLIPNIENNLVCCSTEDGRQLWTFSGQPIIALPLGLPAPAVEGDVAVAGFSSGELIALNVQTGRPLWTESLGATRGGGLALSELGAIQALPVIDRGRVFAVGLAGTTTSLDLRSGRRVWEREVGGQVTPASAGDWVFLLSRDNELMAAGRDDGRIRWVTRLPQFADEARRRNPIQWGPPALAGGRLLIAGSHAQLFEVDAGQGEIIARLRLPDGCTLQPAIASNSAYLLTDGGSVVALRGVG